MRVVVAGALRRPDGRWLMHRRPSHKQHGGLWEFPGGKVEVGETSVNALIRELREELGIDLSGFEVTPAAFAETRVGDGRDGTVILLYTIAAWPGEPAALEEGAELDWFTPEEICALERPPLDIELCDRIFRQVSAG